MDRRVEAMHRALPYETRRDIFVITGGCRIGDRGICERCRMIEEAYIALTRGEETIT